MTDTTIEVQESLEGQNSEYIDPVEAATNALSERFPEEIEPDPRERFTGYLVPPERLVEIAKYLRDDLGFNYLSSVTGVDLIEENKMEVVYHTYNIQKGGGSVVLKVHVDRDDPVVPTLVPLWPGADFQEREIWDLYGIRFEGHPDLRRILMWEGFEGHPMRKDWKEPFFEAEDKPFGSRWPRPERPTAAVTFPVKVFSLLIFSPGGIVREYLMSSSSRKGVGAMIASTAGIVVSGFPSRSR